MQPQELHAFLALAHELNYRRAAARLCVTQPTLSARIAHLERDLGVRLFQRDRSGTRLTAEGRAMVPAARSAVAAMAEVELAARRVEYRRRFTVGVMDRGLGELTWPLLRTFHDARPDLALSVVRVDFRDVLPWLHSGEVDVVVGIGPFGEEDGVVTTVAETEVGAILPGRHPRAEAESLGADWLSSHLTIRAPDGVGRTFISFWALSDLGGPPVERLRVADPAAGVPQLLELVARGYVGAWPTLVPHTAAQTVLPLDVERHAPLQIVSPRPPHPDAVHFCEVASKLAAHGAASVA